MSAEQFAGSPQPEEGQIMADAPSPRARALRDEIFGSALTLDETAYILGLDRTTVAKYLRERSIGGFQIGREWLVPEEELRAYVRRMTDQQLHQSAEEERAQLDPKQKGLNIVQRVRREFLADQKRSGKDERPHMAARFDKFTKRARTVLALAQEEAVGLNHNYIGTEHLLLGLIREGEGVAARVLALQGIELQQARSAVERVIGRGEHPTKGEHPAKGEVGLTPRAKKVMELAVDEARHLNHRYIGTEHLLLGLVREGHGIAASVLESLGATLQRTRAETLSILSTHGPRGDDTAGQESAPPIPTEAAALLREDEQALICSACAARNPHYFRYCFNCGQRLEDE